MAEFALTLPILLLLMFGVIEFARMFQAWITLQNAARSAARYAITGQWDPDSVAAAMEYAPPGGLSEEELREDVLNELVPCTTGADDVFTRHWGYDCEPGSDDDQGLRVDLARLPSIVERARIGAAGLDLEEGDHYVGLRDDAELEYSTETVGDDQPGWFHVWICSSRRPLLPPPPPPAAAPSLRYDPSDDRNDRVCELKEGPHAGENQYDAGGPGDAVEIVVFFNHPLITPLGLVDYVQLQARRVMINESFRSTRVVNLPPQLALPTFTPSRTPMPSNTPLPSSTPTITITPTKTDTPLPSETPSPTPLPECDQVWIGVDDVILVDNYLQIRVHNDNEYGAVFLTEAMINWEEHILFPSMYTSEARLVGRSRFWAGNISNPPTFIDRTVSGWINDPPDYVLRRFDANSVTTFQLRFSNGPSRLSDYYTTGQFGGSYLTLGRTWGGIPDGVTTPCTVMLPDIPTPTPPSETPTNTPTPDCTNFEASFVSFETNAVAHFQIRNTDIALAQLTGFSINWDTYNRSRPPITLDFVSVGGTNAFDPAAIIMWDGNDTSPPASSGVGEGGWQVTPLIRPNEVLDVWFDFDGTSGRLDLELGYDISDFNETSFEIDFICNGETPNEATPEDTPVPTNTFTRTPVTPTTPAPEPTDPPVEPTTPAPEPTDPPPPTDPPTPTDTPPPTSTLPDFGGPE